MGVFSKKKKILLLIPVFIVLLSLIFYLSACNTLEELASGFPEETTENQDQQQDTQEDSSEQTSENDLEEQQDESEQGEDQQQQAEGDNEDKQSSEDSQNEQGEQQEQQEQADDSEFGEMTIDVYYADSQAQYLVAEKRVISKENKLMDAMFELLKLPTDPDLVRVIPETTKILGITVEDGIADLNLSQEFLDDRFESDTVDILLVYTIVNTLTEFNEIDAVNFYIEGQKLNILGELDVKNPIYRRDDLIAK